MKTSTLYICDLCGRTSLNEQDTKEHEDNHKTIDNSVDISAEYVIGNVRPDVVKIKWDDGSVGIYRLSGIKGE